MAKDIQVIINVSNGKKIKELMLQALVEIVAVRINDLPVEHKRYVLQKALEETKEE